MNNNPEFELDLDLQMLPAWARQPSAANRYAQYEGESAEPRERRRGDRPFRRDRPPGGERRGPPGGGEGRGRREGRGEGFRGRPGPGRDRRAEPRPEPPREPEEPLPEVVVNLLPERKGIELLARQIKLTGRAYPLFQIAVLILHKPDRFEVQFTTKKGADGKILQPLFVCGLDDSLWLSEEEVAQHVLRQHFDTFYQTERVPTDPPKGTYTLVAQCGLSGTLLGPPNYHDYQNKLRRLHAERFSRMPFEAYKAKVKFVRDEAVVKQWLEEQSFKAEYTGLNVPEPIRFASREEAEKHFREVHLPGIIKSVESFTIPSVEGQRFMSRGLRTLLRRTVEDQRRFPLKVATGLSQQLAGHGLHFFKVNKTVTHVCVARPHFLDLKTTLVSDGVRRIVEFIDAHPHCTRRRLLDALAPTPPAPPTPPSPAPAEPVPAAEPGAAQAATPVAPVAPSGPTPTPEQTAVITDLHWLIHQGHVIEFTDGRMETAKAPKPKPPPPPPKAPAAPRPGAAPVAQPGAGETLPEGTAPSSSDAAPAGEPPPTAPAEAVATTDAQSAAAAASVEPATVPAVQPPTPSTEPVPPAEPALAEVSAPPAPEPVTQVAPAVEPTPVPAPPEETPRASGAA